jgi:hypothetical protein
MTGRASTCLQTGPMIQPTTGGGVLGETLDGPNQASFDAETLALVSLRLCALVWSAGTEKVEDRLTLAAKAVVGEKPEWWAELHETILRCEDPEAVLAWYRDDPDYETNYLTDPMALSEFANPMARAVVQNLPGITITNPVLGGMTSGSSTFVWSDDPVAGQAAVDAAVTSAISTVEMVIAKLDATHS